MCNVTRPYACRLLEAMDAGMIDPKTVAEMALQWLNDDEVEDMCRANDIIDFVEAL